MNYSNSVNLKELNHLLAECRLCPRNCGVKRAGGEMGYCRAGIAPCVYSHMAHFGEEPPISGTRGSGTIFFTHCNMACVYCQNYKFSQLSDKKEISVSGLAGIMLELKNAGCHNVNLVTPTHYAAQIAEAVSIAKDKGLDIPIVYNTSGYESVEMIKLLDGIIDIYLADMRYSDSENAKKYSGAIEYVSNNRQAVREMHRQTGVLEMDAEGIARKGLIIRCLVMPRDISGTNASLEFIAKEISKDTFISLMSQYYPVYKAIDISELSRRITKNEYLDVIDRLNSLGLINGWVQETPENMDDLLGGHRIEQKAGNIRKFKR